MADKRILSKDWFLWLLWTLTNVLGFSTGIGLSLILFGIVGETASFVAFGATVGLAQWLVLRKYFQSSGWWILATALGGAVGLACVNAIHRALVGISLYIVDGSLGFAALGIVLGIAQWWFLRRQFSRAGWWVLASAAGWLVGGTTAWALAFKSFEFMKIITDFVVLGIVAGASSGVVLVLIRKRPAPQEGGNSSPIKNLILVGSSLILIIIVSVREHSISVLGKLIPPPDLISVLNCTDLPPRDCVDDDNYCSELLLFEPSSGPGYIDYPLLGETLNDQYRSFLRRDAQMTIKYASAKVACVTANWDYKHFEPLGLGDMSEADGSTPGTSTGHPDHPPGTHENGNDIDTAYFQLNMTGVTEALENRVYRMEGNFVQIVCKHTRFGMEVYHCTEYPRLLDPWRTALFIAYVTENPLVSVIGVDGLIGPVLDEALDHLAESGWIDQDLRDRIPLYYEVIPEGLGLFRFHHHHMHIHLSLR
jgi:hypothetical protein